MLHISTFVEGQEFNKISIWQGDGNLQKPERTHASTPRHKKS